MKNEPTAATLRIVLEQPTAGVDFGLQEGHGSDYEVVGKQRSKGRDLEFEFTVTAHTSKKPGRNAYLPNFTGPFVQGPAGERFRGYGAFTVSQSNVEAVRRYIARQKEHHQKVSFRDEFIQFLQENGIEYNERFI